MLSQTARESFEFNWTFYMEYLQSVIEKGESSEEIALIRGKLSGIIEFAKELNIIDETEYDYKLRLIFDSIY